MTAAVGARGQFFSEESENFHRSPAAEKFPTELLIACPSSYSIRFPIRGLLSHPANRVRPAFMIDGQRLDIPRRPLQSAVCRINNLLLNECTDPPPEQNRTEQRMDEESYSKSSPIFSYINSTCSSSCADVGIHACITTIPNGDAAISTASSQSSISSTFVALLAKSLLRGIATAFRPLFPHVWITQFLTHKISSLLHLT